jgi:acyl carrier protein
MDQTRQTIRRLFREILDRNNDSRAFDDAESLVLGGRFQSIDVLEIVTFLEERFQVDFSDGFDQGQLDSVDELIRFLGVRAG